MLGTEWFRLVTTAVFNRSRVVHSQAIGWDVIERIIEVGAFGGVGLTPRRRRHATRVAHQGRRDAQGNKLFPEYAMLYD